jgi:hypothetical protein
MPTNTPQPHPLEQRLRLAHQARRAKEHQLDDIRRALCDIGAIEDDDPYGHADLADVIRQIGPLPTPPAAQPNRAPERSYLIASPEWRPGEGYDRCTFRLKTGGGTLQCIFRDGHPPHGHTTTNKNPGTPEPDACCASQGATARVRALHYRWESDPGSCAHCQDGTGTPLPWPCPTIKALEIP